MYLTEQQLEALLTFARQSPARGVSTPPHLREVRLYLTEQQLEALLTFARQYGQDDWKITERDTTDEYLCVVVHPTDVGREFERFVRTDGTIHRYDQDTDRILPAGVIPLQDTVNGRRYNY